MPMEEGDGDAGPAAAEGSQRRKKSTLEAFPEEYLDKVDTEKIEYEITVMEEKLGKKKHNAKAIKDYYEKEKECVMLPVLLSYDVASSSNSLQGRCLHVHPPISLHTSLVLKVFCQGRSARGGHEAV